MSDLTSPSLQPQTYRSRDERVTARPTGQSVLKLQYALKLCLKRNNALKLSYILKINYLLIPNYVFLN